MNLFKVTWINYGELDNTSSDFCKIDYDVSEHTIFYETCNGIRHVLRCDFGSIFDKIHSIVSSDELQNEKPYEDGCDGDWYKFEYLLNGEEQSYEGYVYELEKHEELISLIESCAKDTLEDERKLLQYKCTDHHDYHLWLKEDWVQDIMQKRQKLEEDFLDFWVDIETRLEDDFSNCWNDILSEIQLPNGFIKCSKCNSIIHNKYFKNRKYWGRVWLSDDELGDYEVEYDSGECPVCGQLNNELPYTGIYCKPEEDLLGTDNKAFTIEPDENSNKLYTFDELKDLLKHISDEDKIKISGCKFKLFEECPDDDTGDVYYDLLVYKDDNEIGKINMYYHSNTYFDIINREIKTTNDIPYYKYEMTLYEDSNKDGFGIKAKWNPFDDSKFRCKKCGKVFCSCNTFFTRRDY